MACSTCPPCVLSTFICLNRYVISKEGTKDSDRFVCREAIYEYVCAATAATSFYIRSLKVRDATLAFCSALQRNEAISILTAEWVGEQLDNLAPLFECIPLTSNQKVAITKHLVSRSFPYGSFSINEIYTHGLFDTESCEQFFRSQPLSECCRLIHLSAHSTTWALVRRKFPSFPAESYRSIRPLLLRFYGQVDEDVQWLLERWKWLWAVPASPVAKVARTRLEILTVLLMKSKVPWFAILRNNILIEVLSYF